MLKIPSCHFRLQHASPEQHSTPGDPQQADRDPEAGHPLWHLYAAEQPAVCCPVKPGRRHLPGTLSGNVVSQVMLNLVKLQLRCPLLYCLAASSVINHQYYDCYYY